jgi:hypothetical protein
LDPDISCLDLPSLLHLYISTIITSNNSIPLDAIFFYPQVFLAIRQYFSPSASISRHPPVFIENAKNRLPKWQADQNIINR